MSDTDPRIIGYTKLDRAVFEIAGADDDADAAAKAKAEEDDAAVKLAAAEAEVAKWKSLSRKHEGQAKENAEAAAKLKVAEDAQKTAEQLLQEKTAELETRLNASDARAMRAEVAAEKGLTPAQAKRLQGSTPEELAADADELLGMFKPPAGKGGDEENGSGKDKDDEKDGGKPPEGLKPGASNKPDTGEKDPSKIVENIPRGQVF